MRRNVVLLCIASLLLVTACKRKNEAGEGAPLAARVVTRTVTLYYENPELLLSPETRTLPLPESDAAALPLVVRELVKGSKNASIARLLPADTVVRGVYSLPDGTAIVDLGGATLTSGWNTGSHQEVMAVYSIVTTINANFKNLQRVRILVNGQVAETLGGHIALDKPLRVLPKLVVSGQ